MLKLAQSRPNSASLSSLHLGLQLHLQTRLIMASKCISQFTRSWPSSACPQLLEHSLPAHLWVHSISVSNSISNLTWSRPPSASLNLLDYSLQDCLITASCCIFKMRRWVYRDTGVTEVEWVMGSIYLADPRVDRHHLISISSYLITQWKYTLYHSKLLFLLALSSIWWILHAG
jgi:hypothetical protein